MQIYRFFRVMKHIGKKDISNVSIALDNYYYGHEYWLKKYSGYKKPIYGLIDHGIVFGKGYDLYANDNERIIKNILTFGDYQEENYRQKIRGCSIYKIGPRIAYVERNEKYYTELLKINNKRRTVTLFPAHSTPKEDSMYDINKYINECNRICDKYKIENKRVSLRNEDIKNGICNKFLREGFQVVSSGTNQIDFLPRLKAIIETSDLVISNSLGTHIGYCIYLNVPHILISQKIDFRIKENYEINNNYFINPTLVDDEKVLFEKVFNENNGYNVTKDQYNLCSYYWGFNFIKTKEELLNILVNLERDIPL